MYKVIVECNYIFDFGGGLDHLPLLQSGVPKMIQFGFMMHFCKGNNFRFS